MVLNPGERRARSWHHVRARRGCPRRGCRHRLRLGRGRAPWDGAMRRGVALCSEDLWLARQWLGRCYGTRSVATDRSRLPGGQVPPRSPSSR